MTATVTVEATWRMSRVEFNTAHNAPWDVRGMGEVLLQEAEGGPSAAILGSGIAREGEKKTYGAMPSAPVSRQISDVIAETVEVDGKTISFNNVIDAITAFMEKWRTEDAAKPLPEMAAPQAAPETPMPALPLQITPEPPIPFKG